MGTNSKIEWCHATFNPWRGCTKVSAGCDNCYAETMSKRNPAVLGVWGKYGTRVVASEAMWREPLKWNRKAAEAGERHRVFCASLADVFEGNETLPDVSRKAVEYARYDLFNLIERTRHLDWLLLTKRPKNVLDFMIPDKHSGRIEPLPDNVWLGTSVEDQKTADERIPHLLKVPAKVRFLSMEPFLGPVDLRMSVEFIGGSVERYDKFDSFWVIVGTESGARRRPAKLEWIESIAEQCKAAGVPLFVKQLEIGGKVEKDIERFPAHLQIREFPKV